MLAHQRGRKGKRALNAKIGASIAKHRKLPDIGSNEPLEEDRLDILYPPNLRAVEVF